jgi:release factor glutamine methyltransferase
MSTDSNWLLNDKHNGVKSPEFFADLQRVERGEPLAYVIGWIPFLHTKIYLDSKPLIPRPETEYWVSLAIKEIIDSGVTNPKVLDLCAGSGCIGVGIAKAIPAANIHFAELIDDHHQTIRKNIRENDIDTSRTKQFGGDLFEHVTEKYDFILSNPPYINPELSDRVEEGVTAHEPDTALWGGAGGMEIIERIILEAPKYLSPGGLLYIEHEPEQARHIAELCQNALSYEDQFGVIRSSIIKF